MKFKQGAIRTYEGQEKDIIVNYHLVKKGDLAIGIALIAGGVVYLMKKSFRQGSYAFEEAEYRTLEDLGLIK